MEPCTNEPLIGRFSSLADERQLWAKQRARLVAPGVERASAVAHFAIFGEPVFSTEALDAVKAAVRSRIKRVIDESPPEETVREATSEIELAVEIHTDVHVENTGEEVQKSELILTGTVRVSADITPTEFALRSFAVHLAMQLADELNTNRFVVEAAVR